MNDFSHVATAYRADDFETYMASVHGPAFADYRRRFHDATAHDRTGYLPEFPITVHLELVNRCNLSCVMCWTANHSLRKAALDLTTIKKLMVEGRRHGLPAAMLGMGSEAMVYKDIRAAIEIVQDSGVMDVFFATNGILLGEDMARFLVERQVARCWVSLDAATPETYVKIRGKDVLPKIEANLLRLIRIKDERGSRLPDVRVSFVVQDENRHERAAFVEKWRDRADHVDFQNLSDFSHIAEIAKTGDAPSAPPPPPGVDLAKPFCPYPFESLNVWSDGRVTPCCCFYGRDLVVGRVQEQTLKQIWDGPQMAAVRDQFRGQAPLSPTCRVCLSARDNKEWKAEVKS